MTTAKLSMDITWTWSSLEGEEIMASWTWTWILLHVLSNFFSKELILLTKNTPNKYIWVMFSGYIHTAMAGNLGFTLQGMEECQ